MKAFEIKKERRTYTHLYAVKGVARHRWCMWILFEKATLRGRANTPVFSAKWWACLSYHVCDTWLKMNQTIQINTWTTSKLHLKIRHNSTSRSRGNQQINICIRLCECIFISFLAAYSINSWRNLGIIWNYFLLLVGVWGLTSHQYASHGHKKILENPFIFPYNHVVLAFLDE